MDYWKYQVLNLLEELGGDVRTKVSHQTDVLVVGGTPGIKPEGVFKAL